MERFLTEKEKETYGKKYKRNPTKYKTFKDVINSAYLKIKPGETRIQAFERAWKTASKVVRKKVGFIKKGQNISQDISVLVKESAFYKSSVIDNLVDNAEKYSKEDIDKAEKITYTERTKEFFNKHGNEKYTYNNETKTLNEWLEDYKNGLLNENSKLNLEIMNKIIKDWQNQNPEYDSSVYKGRAKRRKFF